MEEELSNLCLNPNPEPYWPPESVELLAYPLLIFWILLFVAILFAESPPVSPLKQFALRAVALGVYT